VLKTPIHDRLGGEPQAALGEIEKVFDKKGLPSPIRLGLVGTPGVSLAASVGLTIGDRDETALPLTSWGTGTRRLAALEIAALGVSHGAIAVVDEPETGLEPYRQRVFIADIQGQAGRQAFVTTHAPAIIAAGLSTGAVLWRINRLPFASKSVQKTVLRGDTPPQQQAASIEGVPPKPSHCLCQLSSSEIVSMGKTQAEALVARMPVVCEGVTELGFATKLLLNRFGEAFSSRGIFCVDAGGHDRSLAIVNAFIRADFQVGAVVDDEGRKPGSWAAIAKKAVLLRWDNGASLEKAVFSSLSDEDLVKIPVWAEEATGREAKHFCAEIRRALGEQERSKPIETMFMEAGRVNFLAKVCEIACPTAKEGKKARGWFKAFDGGYLLAEKLLGIVPRPKLFEKIDVFLQGVEDATLT
jgi:putative ATP-dependent endonuclease of OLD family